MAKTELVTLDSIKSNLLAPQPRKLGHRKFSTVWYPMLFERQKNTPDPLITATGALNCMASGLGQIKKESGTVHDN